MFPKVYKNKAMRWLCAFCDSACFAPALGAMVMFMHLVNQPILGLSLIAIAALFITLFCDDTRPLVAPICLAMFALPLQGDSMINSLVYFLSPAVMAAVGTLVAALAVALVARLIVCRTSLRPVKWTGIFLGLALFGVSMLMGGIGSSMYSPESLITSSSVAFTEVLLFVFLSATMKKRDDNIAYICKVCAVAAMLFVGQMIHFYIRYYSVGMSLDGAFKGALVLGWGVSNLVGEFAVFMLPPIFYLAHREKWGIFYFALAALDLAATFFTLCRNALLFGIPTFIGGTLVYLITGKSSLRQRMVALGGFVAAAAAVLAVMFVVMPDGFIREITAFFTTTGFKDRGRIRIWTDRINNFKRYPIFGTGFVVEGSLHDANVMLAHNTIVDMLGSCGIVGFACYAFHRAQTVAEFVRRPNYARAAMGITVLVFCAMALLDPIMFYANFAIYYAVILVVTEQDFGSTPFARLDKTPAPTVSRTLLK